MRFAFGFVVAVVVVVYLLAALMYMDIFGNFLVVFKFHFQSECCL